MKRSSASPFGPECDETSVGGFACVRAKWYAGGQFLLIEPPVLSLPDNGMVMPNLELAGLFCLSSS
jgi:hypothetical protein